MYKYYVYMFKYVYIYRQENLFQYCFGFKMKITCSHFLKKKWFEAVKTEEFYSQICSSCIFILFSDTTGNIIPQAILNYLSPFRLYGLWFFTLYYKVLCLWGSLAIDTRNEWLVQSCHFTQSNRNPSQRQRSLC